MKTQHQNPKFGHTQDEIEKTRTFEKRRSTKLTFDVGKLKKTINFCGKLTEFHPVFHFS